MSGHRGQRGQENVLLAGGWPGQLEEDSEDLGVLGAAGAPTLRAVLPPTGLAVLIVSDSQKLWPFSADRQRRRVVCYLFPAVGTLSLCGSLLWIRLSDSPLVLERQLSPAPAAGRHRAPGQQDGWAGTLGMLTPCQVWTSGSKVCWLGVLFSQVINRLTLFVPFRPHCTLRRRLHEPAQLSSCCNNPHIHSQTP